MDATDSKILNLLQASFPLTERPFAEIAANLRLSEAAAIARAQSLAMGGPLRKIGPILDSRALGHTSTLAALSVPAERVDAVAELVNLFPGVTHNYLREAEGKSAPYNMWFTLHAKDEVELRATLSEIERQSGLKVACFDATKMLKVSVRFNLDESAEESDSICGAQTSAARPVRGIGSDPEHTPGLASGEIDDKDTALLRATQDGLSICAEPYAAVGALIGMSGEEVTNRLARMLEAGVVRRVAASIAHRSAGFVANAMVAWNMPEDRIDEIGNAFAKRKEVTHCYARKTAPGWPYNLYTMVHGKSKGQCDRIIAGMSKATGSKDFIALYSTRELKKTSFHI
jgi:DNA-binding Lrp family transcriptional regulator